MELADTSAWTSRHRDPVVEVDFEGLVATGEVATCDVVRFELLASTQDHDQFVQLHGRLDALHSAAIDRESGVARWTCTRAARQGPLHHRRVQFLDLLVAAAAELAEIPVLHYDHHFELIAEVTGQPVRAIAPLGSL